MRSITVGLSKGKWNQSLVAWAGAAGWYAIKSLCEYRPRNGDRLLGFFSASELTLLDRFGVQAWTLTFGGIVFPDELTAFRYASRVEFCQIEVNTMRASVQASSSDCFTYGPDALLRAASARRNRSYTA